jgi:predicted signal transduction protein with EAL and GGDEF domain/DNA-binding response OmpR family regulator
MNAVPDQQPLVLVVDDDEAARLLIELALSDEGLRVAQAGDGLEALASFDACLPDIVLLDVNMPGMDGFDCCRELRRRPRGKDLPVLMLTGHEDMQSIHNAYEAGATDFLTKSNNWSLVAHRVRYMLRASRALAGLAESRRRLASAQRIARMGSWEWHGDVQRFFLSEETLEVLGLDGAELDGSGESVMKLVHPDDCGKLLAAVNSKEAFCLDFRIVLPGDVTRWLQLQAEVAQDPAGGAPRLAGTVQDVTERHLAQDRIRYLAYYDSLTKLPNRSLFCEQLARAVLHAPRASGRLAVMFIDLDNFKRINDTLGHSVGDQVLSAVAERIAGCLRQGDTTGRNYEEPFMGEDAQARLVGRHGGDEFTLFLADLKHDSDAALIARRLLASLALPFMLGGQEVVAGASIGIAMYPDDGKDVETLLRNADAAMFHAKERGRNNYQYYSESIGAAAFQKLALESSMRKALEREEFVLHYQPIVSIADGRIVGAEALLRWCHPDLGMVPPIEFIPLAEETGLIVPLSDWVLRTACRQARAWQLAGLEPVHVAVNVSAAYLQRANLAHAVACALAESGLEPQCLGLELTESVLARDMDATLALFMGLRDTGVQLAIDDFGTGYSSLSYLRRFPLHTLKIDRSFVRDLPHDEDAVALATAIIAMGRSLKLDLIAEGVETPLQLEFLRAQGCERFQGYLFSAAVPPQEFALLLERGIGRTHLPQNSVCTQ